MAQDPLMVAEFDDNSSIAGPDTSIDENHIIWADCRCGRISNLLQSAGMISPPQDLFSAEAASRKAARMQELHHSLSQPGILSLGPGAPRTEYYPFEDIHFRVPTPGHFSEFETEAEKGSYMRVGKYDQRNGKGSYDLATALNYGQGTGSKQLLDWVVEHVQNYHNPPYRDWKCVLTAGSTSMLDFAFRLTTERGQYILFEEYAYPCALETAEPLGLRFVSIKMDSLGLDPKDMDTVLSNWDENEREGKKPRVFYTVPTGQNPSGVTPPVERRRDIYDVCRKHDIFILEDDPYWQIQMPQYNPHGTYFDVATISGEPNAHETSDQTIMTFPQYKSSLVPSYLNLDTDGRVLRMDTFSKISVPGSRTGWVVAADQVIERLVRAHETSIQNPSGFSQVMLYKLVKESWGHEGLGQWFTYLQMEYTKRRDAFLGACERFLPKDRVSWNKPTAGFFVWITISLPSHPDYQKRSSRDIEVDIYNKTVSKGALVVPGHWFQADTKILKPDACFRCTYVYLSIPETVEAIRRFGVAINESFDDQINGITNGEIPA